MTTVHVLLPGDVDDVTVPSGGNVYDRRVCAGLPRAAFGDVREKALPGTWPRPASTAGLEAALAAVPDGGVVLLDGIVACGVPEVLVPQARRLRLAVLVHLPLADETGLEPAVAADLDACEREALHAVHAVVATSPWAARRLVTRHALPPDKVHVVPPGVDPAPVARGTDGASRLLCVASLTSRKGQHLLTEALAGVDAPWKCALVGPLSRQPGYVARVSEQISRLGLDGRITLPGPLTGTALEKVYGEADLVVLPSLAETYGMVVTEALSRAVPVLVSDVAGLRETVGDAGVVVPPGDVAALRAALGKWFAEPPFRRSLRRGAASARGILAPWTETSRRMAAVLARL